MYEYCENIIIRRRGSRWVAGSELIAVGGSRDLLTDSDSRISMAKSMRSCSLIRRQAPTIADTTHFSVYVRYHVPVGWRLSPWDETRVIVSDPEDSREQWKCTPVISHREHSLELPAYEMIEATPSTVPGAGSVPARNPRLWVAMISSK
jgi:hypothetical protein